MPVATVQAESIMYAPPVLNPSTTKNFNHILAVVIAVVTDPPKIAVRRFEDSITSAVATEPPRNTVKATPSRISSFIEPEKTSQANSAYVVL